jgi:hypothetical protein
MSNSTQISSRMRGAIAEKAIRFLALAALLWSLGGLVCLYWVTASQPKKFMPLLMRESDSEADRLAAIETWRSQVIPSKSQLFLGVRSSFVDGNLDADLTEILRSSWSQAVDPSKKPSFKNRLFDLNVGVERFCRDYWLQVRHTLEFLIATALSCFLCFAFPRILPSSILLVVAGFAALIQLDRQSSESTGESLHWILPIFCLSNAAIFLAIYRWWVAPASIETTNDWNKFWLGLLLTGIGVGTFVALVMWGGRVRSSGLSGLGLCIAWGVYLVAVHGWKLIRSLFTKPTQIRPFDSTQSGLS